MMKSKVFFLNMFMNFFFLKIPEYLNPKNIYCIALLHYLVIFMFVFAQWEWTLRLIAVCKDSYVVYACGFVCKDSYVVYACGFVCKDSYVIYACGFVQNRKWEWFCESKLRFKNDVAKMKWCKCHHDITDSVVLCANI